MTRMRAVFGGDIHLGRTLGQGLACSVSFWTHLRETGAFYFSFINRDSVLLRLWNDDKGRKRKLGNSAQGREGERKVVWRGWLAWLQVG